MGFAPAPAWSVTPDDTPVFAIAAGATSAADGDPNACGIALPGVGLKLDGWLPFDLA